jgi:UDP-glucose 4-epimerase
VIDNLSLGRKENFASLRQSNQFSFVEGDVTDRAELDDLFARNGFDTVFDFVANSDIARSHADPAVDIVNTFDTTVGLLDTMRRHGTRQIVFASTSAIYGEADGAISESHGPLMPISHYGAAKLASEAFISSYAHNYDMRAWIVRFPNVVGDRLTHGAVRDFARKLLANPERLEVLGNGGQIKPYLHADDVVDAILKIGDSTADPVNIFNIAGNTRCSVKRIAEIVVEEAGGTAEIVFTGGDRGWIGDVPNVEYDISKISGLGWQPRLDSEGAIRAAARWALDNL